MGKSFKWDGEKAVETDGDEPIYVWDGQKAVKQVPEKKKETSGGGVPGSSMDGQTGLKPIETTEEQRQQAAQLYQEDKARVIDPFLKVSGGDKKLIAAGEKLQREVRNKRETQAAQVA